MRKLALIPPSHLMFKPYSDFVQLYWGEKIPARVLHSIATSTSSSPQGWPLIAPFISWQWHYSSVYLCFHCACWLCKELGFIMSFSYQHIMYLDIFPQYPLPSFPLPPFTPFVPLGFTSSLMFYNYTWSSVSIWNLGAASVRRHVVSDFLRLPWFFYYDYLWLHPFSGKQHSFIFYIAENFSFIFVCVNV